MLGTERYVRTLRTIARTVSTTHSLLVLHQDEHCVVFSKPPSIVCHHSYFTGSRGSSKTNRPPEIPMLQRARHTLKQKVNLVHRLDRGASGCLITTFKSEDDADDIDVDEEIMDYNERQGSIQPRKPKGPTAQLIDAL